MVFIDVGALDKLLGVTAGTALYPDAGYGTPLALLYVGCGLTGEAGETANQLKKVVRDDHGVMTGPRQEKILKELGGTFWYWIRACAEAGLRPSEVVYANLALLDDRKATGMLSGDDGDGGRTAPPAYRPVPRDQSRAMIHEAVVGQELQMMDQVVADNPVMTPEQRQDALYAEAIKSSEEPPLMVWWKVSFTATRGSHAGNQMERLFLAHTTVGATDACAKAIRRAQINLVTLATKEDMKLPKSGPRQRP